MKRTVVFVLLFLVALKEGSSLADPKVVVGTPDPSPPAAATVLPTPPETSAPLPETSTPPAETSAPLPETSAPPAETSAPPDIFGGGCLVRDSGGACSLAAHPSVALSLWAVDLKTGRLEGGLGALPLGACYGLTYAPEKWYSSGASFCLRVVAGTADTKTTVTSSLSLSLLRWAALGLASLCEQGESSLYCHAVLLFGANLRVQ